ncbi:MAG TPA: YbgC/FadM family acyl-CoA thioesterase [Caulobacteraceae bacterium]|jgi:acyl-CoA thioester hydrolase|nr:YbgC/FadM family acyl-CoA thioesterase [Caulobacteraceae bacterium]
MSGAFEGLEHVLPVRVYYEDTDFTGVVYHASYLRFFERGRTEFLRAAGVEHSALLSLPEPCAFAVTRIGVQFRAAARVDDALDVRTQYRWGKGVRIEARQRILRGEGLIAEAEVEVVCIRLDGRPRRPPPELTRKIAPYVSGSTP